MKSESLKTILKKFLCRYFPWFIVGFQGEMLRAGAFASENQWLLNQRPPLTADEQKFVKKTAFVGYLLKCKTAASCDKKKFSHTNILAGWNEIFEIEITADFSLFWYCK